MVTRGYTPMRIAPARSTVSIGCGAVIGIIILVLAVLFASACFWGWILMLILVQFGVLVGFWPCVALAALASMFFGGGVKGVRS